MSQANKKSLFAAMISLISNLALTVLKLLVGVIFRSEVLIADGVHNAGDVIASAATYGSMRISNQPADQDHPYGHGKAEVIGAGVVAIVLLLAAVYIGYHSVEALFGPVPEAHVIAFAAAVLSFAWKLYLYIYTMRIGKEANSKGLIATAIDHLADVYASAAAVLGIGLALIGSRYGITLLSYGDPLAGVVVAVLVLKLAVNMGRESIDVLMEKNVSAEKVAQYESLIRSIPEVKRIDRLRARDHGHYILVDVRVSIPATFTIQQGHDISRKIKSTIIDSHKDVEEVLIHLNPWYEETADKA